MSEGSFSACSAYSTSVPHAWSPSLYSKSFVVTQIDSAMISLFLIDAVDLLGPGVVVLRGLEVIELLGPGAMDLLSPGIATGFGVRPSRSLNIGIFGALARVVNICFFGIAGGLVDLFLFLFLFFTLNLKI